MWTGFVQSLLSSGLSELPERGNRSKEIRKSPGNQVTGGKEEREFSNKAFTDETVTQAKLLATVMGKNCKGASSFQNKLREPCKMYFWFEWEISFIQDFKEISISLSPR